MTAPKCNQSDLFTHSGKGKKKKIIQDSNELENVSGTGESSVYIPPGYGGSPSKDGWDYVDHGDDWTSPNYGGEY